MECRNRNKTFFKYDDQCFKTCYIESSLLANVRDREGQKSQEFLSLVLANNKNIKQHLHDSNR